MYYPEQQRFKVKLSRSELFIVFVFLQSVQQTLQIKQTSLQVLNSVRFDKNSMNWGNSEFTISPKKNNN